MTNEIMLKDGIFYPILALSISFNLLEPLAMDTHREQFSYSDKKNGVVIDNIII